MDSMNGFYVHINTPQDDIQDYQDGTKDRKKHCIRLEIHPDGKSLYLEWPPSAKRKNYPQGTLDEAMGVSGVLDFPDDREYLFIFDPEKERIVFDYKTPRSNNIWVKIQESHDLKPAKR
mmetsp:Transcript_9102/g.12195  ORF Transcript_9102/g.12195 Transcript_9102/m.12195 type:complete len:119 (-) Transcript_9102:71-427(-)